MSSSGGSTPPRNSQDNPAYQPPWLPAWPANPPPLAWWPQAPRPGGPSISTPSVPPVAPQSPCGYRGVPATSTRAITDNCPTTKRSCRSSGPPSISHRVPAQPTQASGRRVSGGTHGTMPGGINDRIHRPDDPSRATGTDGTHGTMPGGINDRITVPDDPSRADRYGRDTRNHASGINTGSPSR